jgi:hypothetical protein
VKSQEDSWRALLPLARTAADFAKLNPTDERAPKLAEWLKRSETSRDWTPAEAVALLDDVTATTAQSLFRWLTQPIAFGPSSSAIRAVWPAIAGWSGRRFHSPEYVAPGRWRTCSNGRAPNGRWHCRASR